MKPEFYVIEKQELKEAFKEFSKEAEAEAKTNPVEESERLNRSDAGKFLGVSYPTMHLWTKKGTLKEHGQGRKKFYLRKELIEVMKQNA
ncbi:MAG: helix-turn-helix domain-containing protein [Bacteroidetes bacterium]|nr:helix-turn-helix domain-containing protein [Bacteroidota bacterium]